MNPEADKLAWVEKAEGDFTVAVREMRARTKPSYDAVCFHAQQCAEKYLKSNLVALGKAVPRIHDLRVLLQSAQPDHPEWAMLAPDANLLTEYAVFFRYPGRTADKILAKEALAACRRIRDAARTGLKLKLQSMKATKKKTRRSTRRLRGRKTQ